MPKTISVAPNFSSIFVRQATILDCAVVHPSRGPIGQSWWVDVEWQGELDSEGVVFDFGLAKKSAKKAIDDHFDHRLLAEHQAVIQTADRSVLLCRNIQTNEFLFGLDTYPQGLALLETGTLDELFLGQNLNSLESQIANVVKQASPSNVTKVKIKLSTHLPSPHYFSYTHSLRNHFGNCQRFHGHSNIIEVFLDNEWHPDLSLTAKELLSDRYLVAKNYQSEFSNPAFDLLKAVKLSAKNDGPDISEHSPHAWISYQGSQGAVQLVLPSNKPIWLEDESSIENISSYVLATLLNKQPQLRSQNLKVLAYEGLGKGAVSRSGTHK